MIGIGAAIPLIVTLLILYRRAVRRGKFENYTSPFKSLSVWDLAKALFWQLDIVGIVFLIAIFSMVLVPFTIAKEATIAGETSAQWRKPRLYVPLVLGLICFPFWIIWEHRTRHPLVP